MQMRSGVIQQFSRQNVTYMFSVSGTKTGVKCDLLRLEGIDMANMPIIVDPLPKSAINRNSWIYTSMRPITKIDAREQTVKVSESLQIVSL